MRLLRPKAVVPTGKKNAVEATAAGNVDPAALGTPSMLKEAPAVNHPV
jgi:hypothetical protein